MNETRGLRYCRWLIHAPASSVRNSTERLVLLEIASWFFLFPAAYRTYETTGTFGSLQNLSGFLAMHFSHSTDLGLLQRIVARDTAALADLYDRHSRLLFGLILRIMRDRAEAEEILQEVFVRVWTRAELYDPRLGSPIPWLVRLTRNCAIDRLRARRTHNAAVGPARDESMPEPAAPDADVRTPETVVLDAER